MSSRRSARALAPATAMDMLVRDSLSAASRACFSSCIMVTWRSALLAFCAAASESAEARLASPSAWRLATLARSSTEACWAMARSRSTISFSMARRCSWIAVRRALTSATRACVSLCWPSMASTALARESTREERVSTSPRRLSMAWSSVMKVPLAAVLTLPCSWMVAMTLLASSVTVFSVRASSEVSAVMESRRARMVPLRLATAAVLAREEESSLRASRTAVLR
mmetsp:Transcript_18256/g.69097  ORF Transcript_18256/g.69097 Transcript_18256/m.69097 type:complete len:226 (+) Transcript_18256:3265-3942(+)